MVHKRKEQLAKYDRFFKRFEHSKALDAALNVSYIKYMGLVMLNKTRAQLFKAHDAVS